VPRLPRWPALAAFASLLAVAGIGIALFPAVPEPMPVHFDASFRPDRWGAKSLAGFLSPVFIGLGVTLLLWLMAALLPVLATLGGSPGHPAPGVQLSPRAPASTQTLLRTRRMLEKLTVSVAALIGTVALLTWFGVPGWAAPWAFVLLVGTFLGVLVFDVVGIVRSERSEMYGPDA
jgi:uncharacterized membrane protein